MQCNHRRVVQDAAGFTLLEMIIVLFLLGGLLGLIIPRMSIGDSLGSVGRRWVGTLRSFQEMAMATQKTVRLYVDLDRGMYWPMVIDGNQEKIPLDATWAIPISLPESIRFVDFQVGTERKESGRAELFFYPNGRIDQATMHLADANNNIMGVLIEPVTALIRVTDQRIDPPRPWTIPDRIRPLLQAGSTGSQISLPLGIKK
ncbi:MAG TPA: prepilin-type N-terminal cleavage/methylation domain-containing protein [Nitrospira sp.]|nr:prepilin-type N-terminal cleavage/methylation domain-containing protein [Nitrospira sp.]